MRDLTLDELQRLETAAGEHEVPLGMDEEAFRAFYGRTSRALWAYLSRMAGDRQAADDLLQETYYRFLRAGAVHESEHHRRNSLFRIAINLVRDARRRQAVRPFTVVDDRLEEQPGAGRPEESDRRADLARAMDGLAPRDRTLLWLAYAHGASHREIAEILGVKAASVKPMLFRARQRLGARLHGWTRA